MANPRHTPAPWRAEKGSQLPWWTVYAEGREVAEVEGGQMPVWNDPTHPEAVRANALLIAASPELLEALKELSNWIAAGLQASDRAMPDAECLRETQRIAAKARAAVDKAEGRV